MIIRWTAVWAAMCLIGCAAARAASQDTALADELTLRSAGLTTDGPGLLKFFRKRSQPTVDRQRLATLIRQLGDAAAEARERAMSEIEGIGPPAVPLLREAVNDPDSAVAAEAARRCLAILDSPASNMLPIAAARLLAQRQPQGTVTTLLAYLPFADDETVVEEVKTTLEAVAYVDGKPDPAIVQALDDASSLRRAVAVDVLCHSGIAEPRAKLRQLLKDSKLVVRLRAGLALIDVREADAVGTLIELMKDLPLDNAKQVEEALLNLAGEKAPKATLGTDAAARKKAADAWAAWWKGIDANALLDDVRKRSVQGADKEKVQALIRQLGDDRFENREKAQYALLHLGMAVVAPLRAALTNPDIEVSTRAGQLIAQIEKNRNLGLSQVTIRLLSVRKPAGSVAALLNLLPFAEDDGTMEEVQDALDAIAIHDGQADPTLVQALHDKNPLARAAAAEALCQPGATTLQADIRTLLQDSVAAVRMRAALALAGIRDKSAIPFVIASLAELPPEQSAPAEEFLAQLAGDKAPAAISGSDAAARKKRRDSWDAWWKANAAQTMLAYASRAAARQYYYGYTLITLPGSGQVMELGTDGKTRWQLSNLQNPMDVRVLSGNRVLVAEFGASQVTERNLKNEVLWQKSIPNPLSCRRLTSGNTFIVTRNEITEVDRGGRAVTSIKRNMNDIAGAEKMRDGQIVMVSNQGYVARLDASGKELKRFNLPNGVGGSYVDITPKGHVIVPQQWMSKVTEFDADGKQVWEGTVQQPLAATRLQNGNTLISSQWWPYKIYELDKAGKVVWEYQTQNYAGRVHRR